MGRQTKLIAPNSQCGVEKKKEELPQEVTNHNWECNQEFHSRGEVEKSQTQFPWKVVEPYDGKPWVTWDVLGLKVKDDKYKLRWRNCADIDQARTEGAGSSPHHSNDLLHPTGKTHSHFELCKEP